MTVAAAGLAALGHAADLLGLELCRIVFADDLNSTAVLTLRAAGPDDDLQRFARYHIEQSFDKSPTPTTARLLALQMTTRTPTAPELHFQLSQTHRDFILISTGHAMQGDAPS